MPKAVDEDDAAEMLEIIDEMELSDARECAEQVRRRLLGPWWLSKSCVLPLSARIAARRGLRARLYLAAHVM
jgi:hypothetical protein